MFSETVKLLYDRGMKGLKIKWYALHTEIIYKLVYQSTLVIMIKLRSFRVKKS